MAIYRCVACDEFMDDDYFPGEDAEPFNMNWEHELICPECVADLEDDEGWDGV